MMVFLPVAGYAHTESDPLVVDLLAGQTEDIGDVEVWNDADNLYVKFVYTGPDCGFLEVHLQVDEDQFSADILTKKGNPIPGQFEKYFSDGCFTEHTFTYDLAEEGFAPNDILMIAAHAAMGIEEAMTIVSGDGQTVLTQRRSGNATIFTPLNQAAVLAWEPGPAYPNDGSDDSGWEGNSLWDQRLSIDLRPTGADWIWESYRVLDPVYGTVLTFQRTFDIGYPIDGNLLITCDNGYEVFLNGTSLGSDNVYGEWRTSDLKQEFVDVNGCDAVGSYPLIDAMLEGTNVLTIDAPNEYFNTDDSGNNAPGTASSNPGACIFAMDLSYYADGETAWGEGFDFPGKNWATYFTYGVQEPLKDWVLPSDPVGLRINAYPGTSNNYFDLKLWNVGTGYDISDGVWTGWCADEHVFISLGTNYTADVYSSLDPDLSSKCDYCGNDEQWDYVNYILNNKLSGASANDIQQAIWYFTDAGTSLPSEGTKARAMVDDALTYGEGFFPVEGQIGAVILAVRESVQLVFIEVDP